MTVLVVDDNEDSLEMLAEVVRRCGATPLLARNASAALGYIDTAVRLDLVLTDIAMPGVDGIGLARLIRQNPTRRSVPIIALTAFYEDYPPVAEFDAYLRKPVDIGRLCTLIAAFTSRTK